MRHETLGLLVSIRDASRFIAEDTAGASYDEFLRDRRMRQLVERNLILIGEAINRLRRRDPEVAQRVTGIQRIVGMRNVVVHRYDVIDLARHSRDAAGSACRNRRHAARGRSLSEG